MPNIVCFLTSDEYWADFSDNYLKPFPAGITQAFGV